MPIDSGPPNGRAPPNQITRFRGATRQRKRVAGSVGPACMKIENRPIRESRESMSASPRPHAPAWWVLLTFFRSSLGPPRHGEWFMVNKARSRWNAHGGARIGDRTVELQVQSCVHLHPRKRASSQCQVIIHRRFHHPHRARRLRGPPVRPRPTIRVALIHPAPPPAACSMIGNRKAKGTRKAWARRAKRTMRTTLKCRTHPRRALRARSRRKRSSARAAQVASPVAREIPARRNDSAKQVRSQHGEKSYHAMAW